MARIPTRDVAALSPAQRRVHDEIVAGPRGQVAGPLAVWLESVPLADKAQALGAFCRYETRLPPRLSELAILVTGAYWAAGYEWHTHAPIAIAAGLDPAAVEAIRTGRPPALAHADEQAVYAFAHELLHTRQVSDATYQATVAHLTPQGTVELVGILGYYALISMTIRAFAVPVPDGADEPFAAR